MGRVHGELISLIKQYTVDLKVISIADADKNKDASFWDDSSFKSCSPRDQRRGREREA